MTLSIKSLYGFSPTLPSFVGKSPADQVKLLQDWGTNAVFGGYQEPAFVEAVHQAGLKIYAEFGCFMGEAWWQKVPASRPITETGQPLAKEKWYCGLNPTTPQLRQERLAALEQLLTTYDLDGVWLDFIRWPCHWEVIKPYRPHTSFDPDTLACFSRDTGLELPPGDPGRLAQILLTEHGPAWTKWRCRQITAWVAEAKAVLQRVKPEGRLGLFGVPWRLADFDSAILKVIGQDYRALGQYVDVFSPMVYHAMCGRSPDWIRSVTAEIHTLSGKPVWPIIQSVDKPRALSADEYGQALDVALHSPEAEGVLVFHMEGALNPEKLAVTKRKFQE